MHKKLILLIMICAANTVHADTINVNWVVDGNTYDTSTCTVGGDLILPTPPTPETGYHFVGWARGNYAKLEYIESSGTQYIDTGVVPTKNTKIEIRNIQKVSDTAFGVVEQIYAFSINEENYYGFGGGQNGGSYTRPNLVNLDATIVMSKDDGLVINGQQVVAFSNVNDFTTDLTFWLFARNSKTTSYKMGAQRTYYFKMWNNGTLVRDLIPAKRSSDNVLGMYDTVSHTFFTNQGTGDFVAGPETGEWF